MNADLLDKLAPDLESQPGSFFLFKACVLQLYHTVQIITFLTRIVVIAWLSQVKTVIRFCYSLSQLNMS